MVSVALAPTYAQTSLIGAIPAGAQTGLPPSSAFDGVNENIDMGSGNLHVEIPLVSLKGRADSSLNLKLIIDSNRWTLMSSPGVFTQYNYPGFYPPAYAQYPPAVGPNFAGGRLNTPFIFSRSIVFQMVPSTISGTGAFTLYDTDGNQHSFPNVTDCYPIPNCDIVTDAPSNDRSSIRLTTGYYPTPWVAYLKDGSVLNLTQNNNPNTLVTPNGNTISYGSNSITDSLGRVISYGANSIAYYDSNGQQQTIQVSSTQDNNGPTGQMEIYACTVASGNQIPTANQPPVPWYQITPYGPSETTYTLQFPNNGPAYKLTYDALGELIKIVYPSGGYTRYDYISTAQTFMNPDGWNCTSDARTVSAKHVCTSSLGNCSSSTEETTTYGIGFGISTVTRPDGSSTQFQFVYDPGFREVYRYVYDKNNGPLLRTIQTKYLWDTVTRQSIADPPTDWYITYNDVSPALTYHRHVDYDTINEPPDYTQYIENPVTITDYGFNGNVIRTTKNTWMKTGVFTWTGSHILDRLSTSTTTDSTTGVTLTRTLGYDNYGNMLSDQKTGTGIGTVKTSYTYDSDGNVLTATDPKTNKTTFSYNDSWGWAQSTCAPPSGSSAYLTGVTDALNHVTKYSYDSCTGLKATVTDPNNQATSFHYDALNRLTEQDNPDGGQTTNTYVDTPQNSVTQTTKITSSVNKSQTTLFDGLHRTSQTQLVDPQGTDYVDVTYDQLDRKASVSNPYRSTNDSTYGLTSYTYDGLNRTTQVAKPDNSGTTSVVTTQYSGNETIVTDEAGKQRRSFTDALGRLIEVDEPGPGLVPASSTGSVTITGYERSTVIYPCGNGSCQETIWDGTQFNITVNGHLTQSGCGGSSATPSACASTLASSINSDANAYVTATANGGVVNLASKATGTSTNYSLLATAVDQNTQYFPTGTSFLIGTSGSTLTGGQAPGPGPLSLSTPMVTQYTYDSFGNLTSVAQELLAARSFAYDALSRLTSATNLESGTVTYTYDLDSNAATKTDARSLTTTYSYDQVNRPTGMTYSNGDHAVTYTYDQSACLGQPACYNIGRRTSMTDAAGSENFAYDKMGRVLTDQRTTNSITKSTVYAYLPYVNGSVNTITYPSGRTVTYSYNSVAQPTSGIDATNGINFATAATYAPQGASASVMNGSNLATTFIYNDRLQPCWIYATTGTALPTNTLCTGTATSGNVLDLKYNFNLGAGDNGNVVGITNNRDTTRSQVYTYDALNRIATAGTVNTSGANCWSEVFGIDPYANLLSRGPNTNGGYATSCAYETPFNYTVNTNNQISSSGFGYDTAGNLVQTGWGSYAYNAANQMAQAGTGAASTTYLYDGDGNRVEKKVSGAATKLYWYAGGNVLDETDGTGNMSNSAFNEYVYFGGKRIARINSGNVFYYVEDHLGTSREIVQAGQSAACYDADFYPYGGEITYTDTCDSTYKFTGKERDPLAENGSLDNFGARFNSSGFGRFMSPDPMGIMKQKLVDPQQWNKYAYVRNNPLRFVDPTGMYIVVCQSDDKKCQKAASKFERQRQKDLKSKDEKVRNAAAAWGNPTDHNNINVTFKPQAQVDADAHTAPGYTTQAFVKPGAGADHKPNIQAEFSESLGGSSLGQVIAHEGSHIEDDMSFLNSYNGATGKYNPGLNFTNFDTEFQAFEAGSGVKSYSEFQRGPKGYQQLEDYIYRAYPNADDLVFPPAVFPQ
jgi:RHS repeat-associated protein